jgi:hypothetical protein
MYQCTTTTVTVTIPQVTIQYFDVLTTLDERARMCGTFVCACERCQFEGSLGALADAFMSHAVNSIAPVWLRVTSPDKGTVEPAARDQVSFNYMIFSCSCMCSLVHNMCSLIA